ncbi:MAG: aconitate hydratase, partial [Verrucomicrobia bacterium]|nr:aconitate hydratase [Verrucomicrobiota bacterium]
MSISDQCLKKLQLSGGRDIHYYSLPALADALGADFSRFPYSVKVFLEMMVRMQSHPAYEEAHITGMAAWTPSVKTPEEFPYMPSRVLLQDFTGV